MARAARVTGRLVDPQDRPLAKQYVSLAGESKPATSVLDGTTTDADGRFAFAEIPPKPYRFATGAGRKEAQSEPFPFAEPKEYVVELIYDGFAESLKWRIARSNP
jgi:hypothetical protein